MTRRHAARAAWVLLTTVAGARAAAQAPPVSSPTAAPWVQGATCYEVFVRSFRDSDGDGIGDLKGLISALDYINDGDPRSARSLGARCLWLMPIMESPGYHGYDVSDYYRVARVYGTNDDFKRLVQESHQRGIAVLVDMVINHTSSEYPPFQRALRDPASPYRSWFRFAPTRGPDNRWGNNNWHRSPVRDEYYYGFFWRGMPDLNYEGPDALNEMKKVASFWLNEMGADGFRLDAVRYLVEDGARVDDTPGTHAVLREYGAHVRRARPGAFTIGEVFDSTGTLLAYYPDQLDAYFAFEVGDSLIAGVRRGDARGILAPVLRLQDALPAERWAPFLRNHDQPRTRTEFDGDWGKARVASLILLTLPGLPFVYYGEELGMTGPKPDERIRTPMAWSRTAPHAGFTGGTPWQPLAADSLEANVEAQNGDPRSLLNLHRTLIRLRAATPALGRGRMIPLATSNPAAVAFLRHDVAGTVLVIVNVGPATLTAVRIASADDTPRFRRLAARTLYGLSRSPTLRLDASGRLTATADLPGHSGFVIALGGDREAPPP